MAILPWLRWSTALFLFLSLTCAAGNAASPSFENMAIVRTVELNGALTHITTRYTIRALQDDAGEYTFALGKADGELTTWMQAKVKGAEDELALKPNGFDSKRYATACLKTLSLALRHTAIHGHTPRPSQSQ